MLLLLACTDPTDTGAPKDSGEDTATQGELVPGVSCAVEDRAGEVALWANGDGTYVAAQIDDRPDPWYGPADVANETCGYHHTDTEACGTCGEGEVCGWSGQCETEARARHDVALEVRAGGETWSFTPDEEIGQMWGEAGPLEGVYTMTLTVGDDVIEVPEMTVAADMPQLTIAGTGSSMDPEGLVASWPADTGRVRTTIPINHHAGGPTFTRCDVAGEDRTFTATQEMLEPLSVVTGIEFQGVEHANVASVTLTSGCIDIRLGTQIYAFPIWEG